jgi:class 3 adenylate cyclase
LRQGGNGFAPYLPRLIHLWAGGGTAAAARTIEGSLVSADVSGFTQLSERLARKGKLGAEELILLLSGCFEGLIGIADGHGGDVLKFRGDALLLLFSGDGHERHACRAANDMQWFIENAGPTRSSVGPVALRMSTGVHSGPCHFFVVGSTHRELVVTGPAATATMRLESAAAAGEVLVSHETAAALERSWLDEERADGRLLKRLEPERDVEAAANPPVRTSHDPLDDFIPRPLRSALVDGVEPEHRQVTAGFVKWSGSDGVLATEGEEA